MTLFASETMVIMFLFRLLKVCVSKVKLIFLADGTIEISENFWKKTKCSAR